MAKQIFKSLFVYILGLQAHYLRRRSCSNYARIGDLLLTFKLLNTPHISSESKLVYAYIFFHRHDVAGIRIPNISDSLGMPPVMIRMCLKELENKNHIKLITEKLIPDLCVRNYYYDIVDATRYGMLDLEKGTVWDKSSDQ